ERADIGELVEKYAIVEPKEEAVTAARLVEGVMVISHPLPSSPPQWKDSEPLDVSSSPFQEVNDF
nr:hypothetical protein [Methanothrix soehngenii]